MRTEKKSSRSGRVSKINLSHVGMIIESDRSHGRTSLIQAGVFILVTVCRYVRGYYEFLAGLDDTADEGRSPRTTEKYIPAG